MNKSFPVAILVFFATLGPLAYSDPTNSEVAAKFEGFSAAIDSACDADDMKCVGKILIKALEYATSLKAGAVQGGGGTCSSGGGSPHFDACWYVGIAGDSCTDVCGKLTNKTYDGKTASVAGAAGTKENCETIANDLGFAFANDYSSSSFGTSEGLGCFGGESDRQGYRLISPGTTAGAKLAGFKRICACK